MMTSHKLTVQGHRKQANQWLKLILLTFSPEQNTIHLLGSQLPQSATRAGGLGLVLMEPIEGYWLLQKMTAPGKFKMRNHIWSFLGTWTTHQKSFWIIPQPILHPTERRRKSYSHLSWHTRAVFFSCSAVKANWPQLFAAMNLPPFSLSLILFCLKLLFFFNIRLKYIMLIFLGALTQC